jgi:hypothetical protein
MRNVFRIDLIGKDGAVVARKHFTVYQTSDDPTDLVAGREVANFVAEYVYQQVSQGLDCQVDMRFTHGNNRDFEERERPTESVHWERKVHRAVSA